MARKERIIPNNRVRGRKADVGKIAVGWSNDTREGCEEGKVQLEREREE